MKITLYGHSDDCIEIEGSYRDEVGAYDKKYLLFADGTQVSGEFTDDGVWRFEVVSEGLATATLEKFEGEPDDDADDSATDRLTLECPGDLSLVCSSGSKLPEGDPDDLALAGRIMKALSGQRCLDDRADHGEVLGVILEAMQDDEP